MDVHPTTVRSVLTHQTALSRDGEYPQIDCRLSNSSGLNSVLVTNPWDFHILEPVLYCIFIVSFCRGFLKRGFTALNFQSSHPVLSIHSFHSIPKKWSLEISPIFQQPSHILRQGHGNNGRNRNNRHRQNWNGGGHGNAGGHGHGGHNGWHNSWQPWPHLGAYNFIYSIICI